jgi:catechol 2,3-dioxygenase-like lactoylglutathione lyase family enzyme
MFLRHVEIFVTDPLKSKEFYQNVLGFEVTAGLVPRVS